MVQGPEAAPAARLAETGQKSRGSAWPGLFTCCGRKDGSLPFEGSKVSEIQHGEGPGSGCVVFGCDFVLTERCRVTGTRACVSVLAVEGTRLSWSQPWTALWLLLAAGWQLGAGRRAGKNRGPQVSVLQRRSCP